MIVDSIQSKKDNEILKSFYYGDIIYEKREIINFNKGLLGFEHLSNYILRETCENPMFKLLHSIEDERVAFVVLSPFDVMKYYEIDLEDDVLTRLEIEEAEDVMLLNTVTLNSDPKKITTNLRAPIVINIRENKAEQIILKTEDYKIKQALMEAR